MVQSMLELERKRGGIVCLGTDPLGRLNGCANNVSDEPTKQNSDSLHAKCLIGELVALCRTCGPLFAKSRSEAGNLEQIASDDRARESGQLTLWRDFARKNQTFLRDDTECQEVCKACSWKQHTEGVRDGHGHTPRTQLKIRDVFVSRTRNEKPRATFGQTAREFFFL